MKRNNIIKIIAVMVIMIQLVCFNSAGSIINTKVNSIGNAEIDNINMPPSVDFQLQKQRKVDLKIVIGDTSSYTVTSVNNLVNSALKPALVADNINCTVSVTSSNNAAGAISGSLNNMTFETSKETYYVYISNNAVGELTSAASLSNILSIFLSNNVNFVGLGTSTNKSQFETLISKNGGCGKYIDNSNASSAFSQLADYICKNSSANIVINIGDTGYSPDTVKSRVNAVLKPLLSQSGINNTIIYKNEKKVEDRLIWYKNSANYGEVYAYDPNTDTTTMLFRLKSKYFFKSACISSDNKIYYIQQDNNSNITKEIRVYDLNTNKDALYALTYCIYVILSFLSDSIKV